MKTLKRYRMQLGMNPLSFDEACMVIIEDPNGEWVKFEDVEAYAMRKMREVRPLPRPALAHRRNYGEMLPIYTVQGS